MPDQLNDPMAEATRLTRAGRLADATALIQRTLGGQPGPGPAATTSAGPARPQVPARDAAGDTGSWTAPTATRPGPAATSCTSPAATAARPCPWW